MKDKFKTIWDIDFVMAFQGGNVKMPLRNLMGEPAMVIFQGIHFIHLININSKKGLIPFNIKFKRFLSEQTGFSIRKIEYMVKKLILDGRIIKEDRVYTLSPDFRSMFHLEKAPLEELPWKDMPNYQKIDK